MSETRMSTEILQMTQRGFFSACYLHLICCFRISAERQTLYNGEYSLSLPEAEAVVSTASAEEAGKRNQVNDWVSLQFASCLLPDLSFK